MKNQIIEIPRLNFNVDSIKFITDLWFLNESEKYTFDFANVGKIEPFSLLFLSSELNRFRESRPNAKFAAINVYKMQHAADMGFFKAFGVDYGGSPIVSNGNSTYIPIKIFNCKEIIKSANLLEKPVGDYLTDKAISLSNILTQSSTGDLFDTLVYSIREILRNVVEHSESKQFGFCAQFWQAKKTVSLAIIDRGIGLKQSLNSNPHLKIETDLDAIKLSIQPGISGKAFEGSKVNKDDVWANSGYGLYMTSNICKLGGSFVIASGTSAIYLSDKKQIPFDIRFKGTILNLSLNTSKLDTLNKMLSKLRNSDEVKNAPLTPSTVSLGKKINSNSA